MSAYEHQILPSVVLFGLMFTIAWGAWCSRQDRIADIRAGAFNEAADALQSLAKIAEMAAVRREDGNPLAAGRAYYYDRAAMIVRSIPASRS